MTATRQLGRRRSALAAEHDWNYSDPAAIHGAGMPGLAELQAGATRVQVAYEQLTTGARINYRSADPALVAALHAWFDAQKPTTPCPA